MQVINSEHSAAGTPTTVDRPVRVLIVDDVWDNRDFLGRWISRRGTFEISEASGGLEALDLVEQEEFDLVLLDIMMPDLDGTEVVRAIRRSRSASELPVIMVTAKNQSEDLAMSMKLGANDYITKPLDFTVTWARIQAQLERKRDHDWQASSRKIVEEEADQLQRVIKENCETLRRTHEQLAHEIGHRQRYEERVQYLARHDALTGLENQLALRERLAALLGDAAALAREPILLFVDLDRFKTINDLHGRLVGDQMLQDVAKRLQDVIGAEAPIARLGSDEFAVLLMGDGRKDAEVELGEAVISALSKPFDINGLRLLIGASCGVARASSCDDRAEVLVEASSLAMQRAKTDGRGRVTRFEPYLLEAHRERAAIEVGLRAAIQRGELEVYYQPLIKTDDNKLACFEALVRWNHPTKGLILPAAFIQVAEESGLINELGLWVLRQACYEAMTWPSRLHVAVNLSPVQLTHPDLIGNIQRVLTETGLEPHRLELELTEASLFDSSGKSIAILSEIRSLGIRVSIDDFGTSYSCISYLRHLAFDKLKIDRRFVECLDQLSSGSAVIEAITRLGATVGIETTAEGVETSSQFAAAARHGCTEVQGYYISEPLPAEGARKFIK